MSFSEILVVCHILGFGHIVRLKSDVSMHSALCRHIDLSVGRPPGPNWRRLPGKPRAQWTDLIRRDSNSSPVELWRRAICRGHAVERCNGPRRLRDTDDDNC